MSKPDQIDHFANHDKQNRIRHWNQTAGTIPKDSAMNRAYHRRLHHVYRYLIPEDQRVLEIGSGEGNLLAALKPDRGTGIDFSPAQIENARQRHPQLSFIEADVHALAPEHLKIVDFPVRYRERKYGETNIQRWRHGWLLLRMVVFAAGKLKFI